MNSAGLGMSKPKGTYQWGTTRTVPKRAHRHQVCRHPRNLKLKEEMAPTMTSLTSATTVTCKN